MLFTGDCLPGLVPGMKICEGIDGVPPRTIVIELKRQSAEKDGRLGEGNAEVLTTTHVAPKSLMSVQGKMFALKAVLQHWDHPFKHYVSYIRKGEKTWVLCCILRMNSGVSDNGGEIER